MAKLQKFKLLATQCALVGSPTQSPTTSPVIHIRRRKTLRMLLGRTSANGPDAFHRRFHQQPPIRQESDSSDCRRSNSGNGVRLKLKDLFVSSPSPPQKIGEKEAAQRLLPPTTDVRFPSVRVGGVRPLTATLRQRMLMRRAWRPMLMAIPEQSP